MEEPEAATCEAQVHNTISCFALCLPTVLWTAEQMNELKYDSTNNENASIHVQLQRLQTDCQQSHPVVKAKLGLFAVSGLFLGYAEQAGARQLCQACKWCVADEVASLGVNPTWSSVPSITKDAQTCNNNNNNNNNNDNKNKNNNNSNNNNNNCKMPLFAGLSVDCTAQPPPPLILLLLVSPYHCCRSLLLP